MGIRVGRVRRAGHRTVEGGMNWLARRNPTSRALGKPHPDTAESFKLRDTAMRFFNTAGPVDCERHYCLPPLE